VAIDPGTGRGVGIARYEPAGDDAAEVAVAASPAWRHAGLATALISLLAQALERGIVTFTASYLAGNRPVAALVKQADGPLKRVIEQGIAELSIALEHPDTTAAAPNRQGQGTSQGLARNGHGPGTNTAERTRGARRRRARAAKTPGRPGEPRKRPRTGPKARPADQLVARRRG
jgi:hypothetical protein